MDLAEAQRLQFDVIRNAKVEGASLVQRKVRPGLTAHLVGSKLYTVCGFLSGTPSTVNVLDISTNMWKDIALPAATARRDHVSFLWNDYIYLYGGWRSGVRTDYFRVDLLNEGKVEFLECVWEDVGGPSLDYCAGSICEPTKEFILFGGFLDGVTSDRTFCLRIDERSFYEPKVKGQKPSARAKHTSCSVANQVYVYGGLRETVSLSDMYVLTVSSGQYMWSGVIGSTSLNVVEPRMTAVGHRILICGGKKGGTDNFRIYSVRHRRFLVVGQNATAEVQINPSLTANYSHAVVANCEMAIVLGGYGITMRDYWTIRAVE